MAFRCNRLFIESEKNSIRSPKRALLSRSDIERISLSENRERLELETTYMPVGQLRRFEKDLVVITHYYAFQTDQGINDTDAVQYRSRYLTLGKKLA